VALRLRQVALVAPDLGPAVEEVCDVLGLEVCFHDPGVAEFGLENALFAIGDQFLEIVAPITEGTTAERLLEKRGGAGGYMAIFQCDDLDRRRARLADLGVRTVWQIDLDDMRGTHLHPKDVGGAIVSLDEAQPWESWRWAGPTWKQHVRTDVVQHVVGLIVGAAEPQAMSARWGQTLDAAVDGVNVQVDDASVVFEPAGSRGEGIDGIVLQATEQSRRGEEVTVCGVRVALV
jgi:Glyoxalase-like domain